MPETKLYTDRSNARRAAERMLEKGDAPAVDYGIKQHVDEARGDKCKRGDKYEIVWKAKAGAPAAVPAAPSARKPYVPSGAVRDLLIKIHAKPAKATKAPAGSAAKPKPRSRATSGAPAPSGMPVKPVITSTTNMIYQSKFDALARMAEDGDWKGVEAWPVKGVNTYAKKVARYRAALLAAHRAAAD
jgi:hypothetical protein